MRGEGVGEVTGLLGDELEGVLCKLTGGLVVVWA